jgi:hypothetical protein
MRDTAWRTPTGSELTLAPHFRFGRTSGGPGAPLIAATTYKRAVLWYWIALGARRDHRGLGHRWACVT